MPDQPGTPQPRATMRLARHGHIWAVVEIRGTGVYVKRQNPRDSASISVNERRPNGEYIFLPAAGEQVKPQSGLETFEELTVLNKEQFENMAQRLAGVNEVLTGYKSANADQPLPGEPRPEYDLKITSLVGRYRAMAAELGLSVSTARRFARRYRDNRASCLAYTRSKQSSSMVRACDPRRLEAAKDVLGAITLETTVSLPTRLKIVRVKVGAQYEDCLLVPGRRTASRVLKELAP